MKKVFQIIGLISLTIFSFFLTDKTVTVVNNLDDLMQEVKLNNKNYQSNAINATINGNTIIPGIRGRKVNINKSYKNMKKNGYYSDKLYIYDYDKPKISLEDNFDKYIIKGNPSKRLASLIFLVKSEDDITGILNVLNNYSINGTFFVDENWFYNNNKLVGQMISQGHNVYSYYSDYSNENYEWVDMVIKRISRKSISFCYSDNENKNTIDICSNKGNYTIKPQVISSITPLVDIKDKLESGSILSLTVNPELKKELSTIIIYIKSRGLKLVNLVDNISE